MRIGTWNLEGRWGDRHRAFVEAMQCDVLLLTEVRTDVALPGHVLQPSAEMVEGRWWSAVASAQDVRPMPGPHAASALAEVDGWLRTCSSVLPWRGCGNRSPWTGSSTAEKTEHAVAAIEAARPTVWGGDWNHSLVGPETSGSLVGRRTLLAALERLELQVPTLDQPHRLEGVRSIDHVAVPASWSVEVCQRLDATGLSDHDAYVVVVSAP